MSEELIEALNDFCNALEAATAKLKHNLKKLQEKMENPQFLAKLDLPSDVKNMLTAEVKENHVILKPKRYLGAENFSKIMETVKKLNGEYVSKGKNSHFRIPIEKVQQRTSPNASAAS